MTSTRRYSCAATRRSGAISGADAALRIFKSQRCVGQGVREVGCRARRSLSELSHSSLE